MSRNQKFENWWYVWLILLGIALSSPISARANAFPITGSISKEASDSVFIGNIDIPDLASLSNEVPLGVLGIITAGDLLISILLFIVIMLMLLQLFFLKI